MLCNIFELLQVTQNTALACERCIGRKDPYVADKIATETMRTGLNALNIKGFVAASEGERDNAPMITLQEVLGCGTNEYDLALDPLEGTNACTEFRNGAMSVLAIAPRNSFLRVADVYMEKIAVGRGLPEGIVSLNNTPQDNLYNLAEAKNCSPQDLIVTMLKRERHQELFEQIRETNAAIKLIDDGDVAAAISVLDEVDMYIGIGGAPEGILAAVALKCSGGQMQTRLIARNDLEKEKLAQLNIQNLHVCYDIDDMIRSEEVIFIATGITDGDCLDGIKVLYDRVITNSVVMSSNNIQYITNFVLR